MSAGMKSATLQITSNDPNEPVVSVGLTGMAVATPTPDVTVTPVSQNYGNVVVGQGPTQSITVSNDGTELLDVTATTLMLGAGTDLGEFSIDTGGAPFMLMPLESRVVVVGFNPMSTGMKSATLEIASNDPDEPVVPVALTGMGVNSPPPGVTLEQPVHTGGSTSSTTVSVPNVTAAPGHLYLAAIAFKPNRSVTDVTGLGLLWTEVKAQCGGRGQTGISVWKAQGTPSGDGSVTATLSRAPSNAVIAVARYSGAMGVVTVASANTISVDGPCSGGTDTNSYSLPLATTVDDAVVFGAVAMRNRRHTPGLGYTEQVEFTAGTGGSTAGMAVEDQELSSVSIVDVNGSFSGTVDWAVVALEIRP